MPNKPHTIIALDVGEVRIGVARGDTSVRLAVPLDTLPAESVTRDRVLELLEQHGADLLVVGLPRNQQGEETAQTSFVRNFIQRLGELPVPVVFQDESLTSVLAEERLKASRKPYTKADIDAMAATIILTDYLEGRA